VRFTLVPPTVNEPLNALFKVGLAAETVRLADAVLPFNGPAAETIPDVLLYVPRAGAATTTVNVHELLAGIVPPVSVTVPLVATGVNTPPQVLLNVAGDATVMAAGAMGKVSVKPTPLIVAGVPFVIVKLSVLFCPTWIGLGLNTFDMLGTPTDKIALALVPFPALVVVTAPVLLV
jgi:hypothetical protein